MKLWSFSHIFCPIFSASSFWQLNFFFSLLDFPLVVSLLFSFLRNFFGVLSVLSDLFSFWKLSTTEACWFVPSKLSCLRRFKIFWSLFNWVCLLVVGLFYIFILIFLFFRPLFSLLNQKDTEVKMYKRPQNMRIWPQISYFFLWKRRLNMWFLPQTPMNLCGKDHNTM